MELFAEKGFVPHFAVFYHRVADDHPNGWTISKDQFTRHLDYFQTLGSMIDFAKAQELIRLGESTHRTITITFDDGYADNLDFALPEIIDRKIPCTYFVTTQNFLKNQPFDHDLKCGTPLRVHTAKQIRELSDAGIEIGCHTRHHVRFFKGSRPRSDRC